uniref:Lipocalin-2 1 n=1 Tax=Amblyomma cajennense TaxID=34607 RepID=A0A023FQH2_AMBCJ
MNCFIVAILLTVCAAAFGTKPTVETLQRALETRERIWTTVRSYDRYTNGKKHRCVYAYKTFEQGYDYKFDQFYQYEADKWVSNPIYGRISDGATGPQLKISKELGGEGVPYTLLHWNEQQNCGILVFKNSTSDRYECELHVWEPNLPRNGINPCDHEYDEHCPVREKYSSYEPDCLPQLG